MIASDYRERIVLTLAGAEIFVRSCGTGDPVVLLGGTGESSAAWPPLVAALAGSNTVVIPDLRGMGRSSEPPDGYDKRTQALDVRSVIRELGFDRSSVVGHGIGGQVAYAYAALFTEAVERLVVMEARLAGIASREIIDDPEHYVHFVLRGTDEPHAMNVDSDLRDAFRTTLESDPHDLDGATEAFYAAKDARAGLKRPVSAGPIAAAKDLRDNRQFQRQKLTMPVLAMGGAKSVGGLQATLMREVATDVHEAIVPDAGHWLLEERPEFTVATIVEFLREDRQETG